MNLHSQVLIIFYIPIKIIIFPWVYTGINLCFKLFPFVLSLEETKTKLCRIKHSSNVGHSPDDGDGFPL